MHTQKVGNRSQKKSNDLKMSEGVENTVVVDSGGDVIRLALQFVDGVAHRDADAGLKDHRGVIATVAKGDGAAGVETFMTGHREDALTLVGTIGGDIREFRMPAARDALRHTCHKHRLVVGREESRQL